MPWFRVDDGFYSSRKVTQIARADRWPAIGLWTIAGTWSAKELTDGFVPDYQLEELGGRVVDADNLVRVGLWVRVEGGYEFSNWGEYQPTKAEIEAQREKEAERKRKWRESRESQRESRGTDAGQDAGHQQASGPPDPTPPDPTRPGPAPLLVAPDRKPNVSASGTRLTDDWTPSPELLEWARAERTDLDPEKQADAFRDYWIAQPASKGRKSDWDRTFKNWIRNARGQSSGYQPKPSQSDKFHDTLALGREVQAELDALGGFELKGIA